jgi:hypothetical protein
MADLITHWTGSHGPSDREVLAMRNHHHFGEAIHPGAEIACLRDLYLHQAVNEED